MGILYLHLINLATLTRTRKLHSSYRRQCLPNIFTTWPIGKWAMHMHSQVWQMGRGYLYIGVTILGSSYCIYTRNTTWLTVHGERVCSPGYMITEGNISDLFYIHLLLQLHSQMSIPEKYCSLYIFKYFLLLPHEKLREAF